jgi:hypothetical protein
MVHRLSRERRYNRNQSFVVFLDELSINARVSSVKAFDKRSAYEFNEVVVPRVVFCQKDKTRMAIVHLVLFVVSGARGDVRIKADNWFDTCLGTFFIKIYGSIEGSGISEGKGSLPVRFGCLNEGVYLRKGLKK